MEIDPREEVEYRIKVARNHLEAARKRMRVGDWLGVVQAAQLAAENAAKAVIAFFAAPSWSHDPSEELLEVASSLSTEFLEKAEALASIVRKLAPEHARSSYGIPQRRIPPSELYSKREAARALEMGEKALALAEELLKALEA